jgi:ParB family transcriptional regulator, chromosome partitioning protein
MKQKANNDTPNEAIINAIPHHKLKVSDLNPRKQKRSEKDLLELAESIAVKGVLHNLTARPKGAGYEIAIGEGRFLAVELLIKEKRLPKDYPMPVCIKELSDLEMLELATSENIQRADMHPMDEAQAFSDMMNLGGDVNSIALKMGLSQKTVQQRLVIAEKLIPKAKEALLEDKISLAIAQQLTAATEGTQQELLKSIVSDRYRNWSADDIKNFLKRTQMPITNAIFKKELYQGEYSNNLFDDSQKTCFVDSDQAKRLQLAAIEERRAKLSQKWAWVEVHKEYDFHSWEYQESEIVDLGKQGVVITYHPETMKVKIKEQLLKPKGNTSDPSTSTQKKATLPVTKELLKECHHIKTRALQSELSKHHRTCLLLNVAAMLGASDVKLRTDRPQWKDFKTEALETGFAPYLEDLTKQFAKNEITAYPLRVHFLKNNVTKLYDYLKTLSDERLQTLFNLLTASVFGSWYEYDVVPEDRPLPVAVASDLSVDMAQHFTLTDDFLKGYRRTGLLELLKDLGIKVDLSSVQTKSLREHILKQTKGNNYLPTLVKFLEAKQRKAVEKTTGNDETNEDLEAA